MQSRAKQKGKINNRANWQVDFSTLHTSKDLGGGSFSETYKVIAKLKFGTTVEQCIKNLEKLAMQLKKYKNKNIAISVG